MFLLEGLVSVCVCVCVSSGMPPNKILCPSKPVVMGPEVFFKVDCNTM